MGVDERGSTAVAVRDRKGPVEVVRADELPPGLLVPTTAKEVVSARAKTQELIAEALTPGVDFGRVPNTDQDTLFKPGAELVTSAFGCIAKLEIVESEIDHDRKNEFTRWDKNLRKRVTGTSIGMYRYVVKCELVHRDTGIVVGEYFASCSSFESKYIGRPRDLENTVLKMAEKRAHVGAVVATFGLSSRFTAAHTPSLGALRKKYHVTWRDMMPDADAETASTYRRTYQEMHRGLPDSSADWDVEDFQTALADLERHGVRLVERVRSVIARENSPAAVEPKMEGEPTTITPPSDSPPDPERNAPPPLYDGDEKAARDLERARAKAKPGPAATKIKVERISELQKLVADMDDGDLWLKAVAMELLGEGELMKLSADQTGELLLDVQMRLAAKEPDQEEMPV